MLTVNPHSCVGIFHDAARTHPIPFADAGRAGGPARRRWIGAPLRVVPARGRSRWTVSDLGAVAAARRRDSRDVRQLRAAVGAGALAVGRPDLVIASQRAWGSPAGGAGITWPTDLH